MKISKRGSLNEKRGTSPEDVVSLKSRRETIISNSYNVGPTEFAKQVDDFNVELSRAYYRLPAKLKDYYAKNNSYPAPLDPISDYLGDDLSECEESLNEDDKWYNIVDRPVPKSISDRIFSILNKPRKLIRYLRYTDEDSDPNYVLTKIKSVGEKKPDGTTEEGFSYWRLDSKSVLLRDMEGKYSVYVLKEGSTSRVTNGKVKRSVPERVNEGSLRTFTRSDWYNFAGASNFDDGTAPMIYEYDDGDDEFTLIVSGGDDDAPDVVIEIYINDDAYTKRVHRGKSVAVRLATKIINKVETGTFGVEDLEGIGFYKSYSL